MKKKISEFEIRTAHLSSVEGSDFYQIIKKNIYFNLNCMYAYLSVCVCGGVICTCVQVPAKTRQ